MLLCDKISYTFPLFTEAFAPYVDKLEAKKIVKEMMGDEVEVPKVIRVLADFNDFTEADINPLHMLKCTHASSRNIIFYPTVKYNVKWVLQMIDKYKKPFYTHHNEMQYKYVEPRFFLEEKVVDYGNDSQGNAVTFMFYCIGGVARTLIMMDKKLDRYRHFTVNEDTSIKQIAIENQVYHAFILPSNETMTKMVKAAGKLSQPFEFVRVDFYLGLDEKIYFSEFTFTPHSGEQIYSDEYELELGKLWV